MAKAAKQKFTEEDDALLDELGIEVEPRKAGARSAQDERLIAGFEEITRFVSQNNGRLPEQGEDKDIFERLYAVRLAQLQASHDFKQVLAGFDHHGILQADLLVASADDMDDEALLHKLGVSSTHDSSISNLVHVRSTTERKAADEIGQRTTCREFELFKPLFELVRHDLKSMVRVSRRFREDAEINQGEYFIVGGQIAFVAEMAELKKDAFGKLDGRIRVIYDNGTESNILLRSLQKALYKDETGRRISDPNPGPLFAETNENDDETSGTIYVLRSMSNHPTIAQNRELIHKIGVTGGDVKARIANAKDDATYLLADVEVVATYTLTGMARTKVEKIFHRLLAAAQLDINILDRFGKPVKPREWFLVPLHIIDELVNHIRDGSIVNLSYDPKTVQLISHETQNN